MFGKASLLVWLRHKFHGQKEWKIWDQIKASTEEQAKMFELHPGGHGESLKFLEQGVYLA